jgi:hypothetical protein
MTITKKNEIKVVTFANGDKWGGEFENGVFLEDEIGIHVAG